MYLVTAKKGLPAFGTNKFLFRLRARKGQLRRAEGESLLCNEEGAECKTVTS